MKKLLSIVLERGKGNLLPPQQSKFVSENVGWG